MRRTMHKLFFAWDFEKEEKWLNKMSARGMQLVGVGFCKYIFEDGTSGEYSYRLELLKQFPTHSESASYIHFLEETGVEHIGSFMRWVYLRRKSDDGEFDLFSDIDSVINHLKRILTLLLCLLPLEISSLGTNISTAIMGSTINLVCACLLASILVLLSIGILNLCRKIRKLKKERILRE
ncbi:DUF2812 domain-containing protein [Clostridium estertheticum]|uniref:DUF2812 domain-containing protein n=1 Tax=Clostridium estertheticum TaxID=238834 RepID=UPI0013E9148B|nr:DUF2812 domain-containing protein [Clostridium estertheticum]MBZ9689402.1 DUF2812 domain-containing protein [Clostridium estertheticum]